MKCNIVTVRWFDGYLEEFRATEVRFGSDLLFMRLEDGKNRQIPLRGVRWFGMSEESHQRENAEYSKKGLLFRSPSRQRGRAFIGRINGCPP